MPAPPSVAPLAGLLADLTTDLRRGACCLVVCDKGWTLPVYANLRERLRAARLSRRAPHRRLSERRGHHGRDHSETVPTIAPVPPSEPALVTAPEPEVPATEDHPTG